MNKMFKTFRGITLAMAFLSIPTLAFAQHDEEASSELRKETDSLLEKLESRVRNKVERETLDEIRERLDFLFSVGFSRVRSESEQAFRNLEKKRASSLLVRSLHRYYPVHRALAAEALARIKDQGVVYDLLDSLKANVCVSLEGSSDRVSEGVRFRKALVTAIAELTGQTFEVTDYESYEGTKQLEKVIVATEEWLKEHPEIEKRGEYPTWQRYQDLASGRLITQTEPPSTSTWLLWTLAITVVVLAGVVIFLLLRRKK